MFFNRKRPEFDIETKLPLLNAILASWKKAIGEDYEGYKNHCYRMLNFCFFMHKGSKTDREKLIVAAAYHDLGYWKEKTADYLSPSVDLAERYLKKRDLSHWVEEVSSMIDFHHKVTSYQSEKYPLVDVFRKADLADYSLGLITGGVPAYFVHQVKETFPNAGFHKMLMKKQLKWFAKHPLNPFPVVKW